MKTRLTSVTYLGFTATDKRLSNAMLPWLLREIRATNIQDKLSITIEDGCLKAYNGNFEPVIVHRLVDIVRASQVPGVPEELFYILLNEKEGLLHCYLFRANTDTEDAVEAASILQCIRNVRRGSHRWLFSYHAKKGDFFVAQDSGRRQQPPECNYKQGPRLLPRAMVADAPWICEI